MKSSASELGLSNDTGKKQNNNFALASRFFLFIFPLLPQYDVKLLNLTLYGGRGHGQRFSFSVFYLKYSALEFNSR